MENNIMEDFGMEPEVQQPVEQQPESKTDFAGVVNASAEKVKELVAGKGAILDKIKAIPKMVWIAIGGGIVAIIAIILVLSMLGNTYKTPVASVEKLLNTVMDANVSKIVDSVPSVLNGFGESEVKKALKIIKKSDVYKDAVEDADDALEELREQLTDEYGKNAKITLKVTEKEKLEKDDCKEFREQLREVADLKEYLDEIDSDMYEEAADELGLSKSQVKDLVKIAESFLKKCKSAKVSAGYEMTVTAKLTGSELDEPMEEEFEVRVFKVDGRWVLDVFSLVNAFGGMVGGMASSMIGGF